jgi:hypothetical protein
MEIFDDCLRTSVKNCIRFHGVYPINPIDMMCNSQIHSTSSFDRSPSLVAELEGDCRNAAVRADGGEDEEYLGLTRSSCIN